MVKTTVAIACLLLISNDASADCSTRMSGRSPASGSVICFQTANYPDDTHIVNAADRWNHECNGGEETPSMNVGGCDGSSIVIGVEYQAGISTNVNRTCGAFQADTTGALTGGTITIFEFGQYMTGPETGTLYPCASRPATR